MQKEEHNGSTNFRAHDDIDPDVFYHTGMERRLSPFRSSEERPPKEAEKAKLQGMVFLSAVSGRASQIEAVCVLRPHGALSDYHRAGVRSSCDGFFGQTDRLCDLGLYGLFRHPDPAHLLSVAVWLPR